MNSSKLRTRCYRLCRAGATGFSLAELMVAMTIGLLLVYGASKMYIDSRVQYNNNDTIARMQETARYAMSVIEPDIRMSNFWGQKPGSGGLNILVPTGTGADACGANFVPIGVGATLMLQPSQQGTNDSYGLPCPAAGAAVATADTLTIRRASTSASTNPSGTWHICSTPAQASLVNNDASCPLGSTIYDYLLHIYYVDQKSSIGSVPALERMILTSGPLSAPRIERQEVIPGVEDFQVQFGIDTAGSSPPTATQYVDPGAEGTNPIVSIRVWLLVREDAPETGFIDDAVYEYGNRSQVAGTTADLNDPAGASKAYKPSDSSDSSATSVMHYRRLLVSRTIVPRNFTP